MPSVSQPEPARTRATAPTISGMRLVGLIVLVSSRGRFAGSEVDLHEAREGPEVGIREPIDPERVRVAGETGHLGIVARVLREGEQIAADHADAQAGHAADMELLDLALGEGVADIELLDLDVRPRLDEEVDRVDAVVEGLVILDRLLPGAVRAMRVRRAGTIRGGFARLVDEAIAILEEGPLARRVVDIAALHPIHQRIGRKALVPQGRREAGVEVRVHVADLYNLVALRVHERDVRLV